MTDLPALHALIIEDDRNISIILAEALKQAGFNVEVIHSPRHGLARLAEIIPALITLDMHMPEYSGLDMLAAIRADPRLAAVPIYLITGDAIATEGVDEPGVTVLIKPVSFVKLRQKAAALRATLMG